MKRQRNSNQNVSLTLSLRGVDTFARFEGTDDITITQYLPEIWAASHNSEDFFIGLLITTYLYERICIERGNERIRIKGGKCNPCCIDPIVTAICNHLIGDDLQW